MLDIENNFEMLNEPWTLPSIAHSYSESEDLKSLKVALVKRICTTNAITIMLSRQGVGIVANIDDNNKQYVLQIDSAFFVEEAVDYLDRSLSDEDALKLLLIAINDPQEAFTVITDLSRLTQQRYFAVEAAKVRLEAELGYLRSKYKGSVDAISSSPLKKVIAAQFFAYDHYGFFSRFKECYKTLPSAADKQGNNNETRENYLCALALFICSRVSINYFSTADLKKINFKSKNKVFVLPEVICFYGKSLAELGAANNSKLRITLCQLYDSWSATMRASYAAVILFKQLYDIIFHALEARLGDAIEPDEVDDTAPEITMCNEQLNNLSDLLYMDYNAGTVKLSKGIISEIDGISMPSLHLISENEEDSEQEIVDFSINELKDCLVDKVALIPYMFDVNGKTYAICECEWSKFRGDPNNESYWQPMDDMLYQRYSEEPDVQFQPRKYSFITSPTAVRKEGEQSIVVKGLYASLLKPMRCTSCNRIMLPSAGFLQILSIYSRSALNEQGIRSNIFVNIPSLKLQYTASTIKSIFGAAQENFGGKFGQGIYLWPSAGVQGDQMKIEITNLFEGSVYEGYKKHLSSLEAEITSNEAVEILDNEKAELIEFVESIIAHNKVASDKLGYTYTDYLCTLIASKNDQKLSLAKLVTCCKVLYALSLNQAYIEQALAVVSCKYYDSSESNLQINYITSSTLWEYILGLNDVLIDARIIPQIDQSDFVAFEYLREEVACSGVNPHLDEADINNIPNLVASLQRDINKSWSEVSKETLLESLTNLQRIFSSIIDYISSERDYFLQEIATTASTHLINTSKYISTLREPINFDDLKYLNRTATLSHLQNLTGENYKMLLMQTAEAANKSHKEQVPITDIMRTERDHFIQTVVYTNTSLQHRLHAVALDAVNYVEYPVLSSLHVDISRVKEPYNILINRYIDAFITLSIENTGSSGDISSDELNDAAASAVQWYYLCAIDDEISRANRQTLEKYIPANLKL